MANDIALGMTTAERRQRGEVVVSHLTDGARRPPFLDAREGDFPFLSNALNAFAVG